MPFYHLCHGGLVAREKHAGDYMGEEAIPVLGGEVLLRYHVKEGFFLIPYLDGD